MIQSIVPEPSPNTVLWRYMSFSKFVGMVTQKGLYFRRADGFDDKWEGSIGPAEYKPFYDKGVTDMMLEVIDQAPEELEPLTEAQKADMAVELSRQLSELNRVCLINTFISCWHEASHESEAMWKLYSHDSTEGISILTNCLTLKKVIPKSFDIDIGAVQYREPNIGPLPPLKRFFYKRPSYEHEKEVRAVYLQKDTNPGDKLGLVIPVNLKQLIHRVIISPYAPEWIFDATTEVCKRFKLKIPIIQSSLKNKPFHC